MKGEEFWYDPEGKHKALRNICSEYNNGNFFIIIDNSDVIGTGGYKVLDPNNKIGEVKCMFVHPDFQRNGYGKKLLNKIIRDATHKDIKSLKLDTLSTATNANFMKIQGLNISNDIMKIMLQMYSYNWNYNNKTFKNYML